MRRRIDFSVWTVAIAALAVAVGSALSWVDAHWARGWIHIDGLAGDGKVTVLCAVAASVAVTTASVRRSIHLLFPAMTALAGGMIAAIAFYDTINLRHTVAASGRISDGIITTNIGPGLWLVDGAALVLLAGAVLAMRECRRRRLDSDFAAPLPRSSVDLAVSRTVVVVMPSQREAPTPTADRSDV